MNKYWLSGIIFLAYGLALPAFSSDTATLTVNGRISPPTCSMDIVNNHLQQRCGQASQNVDTRYRVSSPAKGVTTELVNAGNDNTRQIVLNRYD
ncbi:DUF2574 family protein [Escherichia albertii]|uniref:DUF2574 family protein n=1 Tax=Escherichia albertii TaxID=208962 RepID=UPI0013751D2B|nr:DUF2574 family protein [Escherichia albertii]MCU7288425.1 YehE family protein [Escherichia albertii]QTA15854.1 DUF2574 family protein [Escherichia albertii]WDB26116.1 DUF2574 family protein [Escherichia albertii]WDC31442.1 DUF2574 family protein [Escherichia albertii]HAX3031896.1 DUF2574 family protein [Escherichia albertii]